MNQIIAQGLLTQGEMEDFSRQSQSRRLPPPVLARADKANSAFNLKFSRLNKRLNSAGQSAANFLNNNVGADPRAVRSDVGSRNLSLDPEGSRDEDPNGQVANKLPFALRWKLNGLLKTVSAWNRGMESDILGSDLPYSSPTYEIKGLAAGQMIPAYLGGSGGSTIPGDLEGALGAEITPEIQAKVQELNSQPIEIYEYVKDTLGYEPYYGVMKGALETLRQGAGNDADLASLLIAMYRAAGFQARYVRGIARIPVDRLAAWMAVSASSSTPSPLVGEGGGEGVIAARVGQVLQAAGIPFTPVYVGGKITNYDVERIWVEVYLPYGEYRGAILNEKAGRMWIPLDPGFKRYDLEGEEIDLLGGMNKTGQSLGEEYLNAATGTTFLQFFRDQASGYLAAAHPDLTLDDIKVNRVLKPERLRLLPNTLPYPVERVISEYAVLPDELIHQAKVTIYKTSPSPLRGEGGGEGDILFQKTFKLPELAGKRFTLSYQGATADDEAVIASYGGLMSTPPYLVKVTPIIRLNGVEAFSQLETRNPKPETSIGLGIKHLLRLDFISPTGTKRVESAVIAGNYYGLGVAAQRSSFLDPDSFVQCPASAGGCVGQNIPSFLAGEGGGEGEVVGEGLVPSQIEGPDTDGLGGRLLYQRAVGYLNQLYADEEEISSYLGIRLIRPEASLVIVGNELEVTYLSGIPQLMEWKGVRIDATSRPVTPVKATPSPSTGEGGGEGEKNFMFLSGYESSSLENLVFEKDFAVESVSAVKAIQLAHAQGMEVVTINQSNIDQVLPGVDCSEEVREDIINKINQGLSVTIHISPLTFHSWTGSGYVAIDPATGDAGYFLSGKIAGGMTVWGLPAWSFLWDLYTVISNPALQGLPVKDPALANGIRKLSGDHQLGKVNEKLKNPFSIQVTTGGNKPRPVPNAPVVFQIEAGGGSFSSNNPDVSQIDKIVDKNGIILVDLFIGKKTSGNPVFVYEPGQQNPTQAEYIIVKIYLKNKPEVYDYFQVLGLPGEAAKLVKLAGDGTGKVLSFSGLISARVEDQFDNPISNVGVSFSVLPPAPGVPAGFKNALIYKPGDCSSSYPLWGECGIAGPIPDMLTDFQGTAVQTILGNADDFDYQFKAEVPGVSSVVFVQHTEKVTEAPILKVNYSVPFTTYGYPINGVKVGERMPKSVSTTLTLTKKEGDVYAIDRVSDGQVEFIPDPPDPPNPNSDIWAVIWVDNEKKNIAKSVGNGNYIADIEVDPKPGANFIRIRGTYTDPSNQKELSNEVFYYVYGVEATVTGISPQPLWVNREGISKMNLRVDYKIEPSGYHADEASVLILEDDGTDDGIIVEAGPASVANTGSFTSLSGAAFDIGKNYLTRLVLNFGTEVEIKGNKMLINMISNNLIAKTLHTAKQKNLPNSISFISRSDQEEDKVELWADLKPDSWDSHNGQIQWKVEDNPDDLVDSGAPVINPPGNGDYASFYAVSLPYCPIERPGPRSYKATASLTIGNVTGDEVIYVTQHNLDDLRQEYWDYDILFKNEMLNEIFDNFDPCPFCDLVHKGQHSGVCPRHNWWIVKDLFLHAVDLENALPKPIYLKVDSGYRCPYGNARVGGVETSNHMKGVALDFDQPSSRENYNVAETARRLTNIDEVYLYCGRDINKKEISKDCLKLECSWPPPHSGVNPCTDIYTHGHIAWK